MIEKPVADSQRPTEDIVVARLVLWHLLTALHKLRESNLPLTECQVWVLMILSEDIRESLVNKNTR